MKKNHNLMYLGIFSVLIALATSGISLYLYRASGDIYLDRSRPGYLPETKEEKADEPFDFSDSGPLSSEIIDEYLKNYQKEIDSLHSIKSPFSEKPLTDDSLGL